MKKLLTSIVIFALLLSNSISKAQTTHPVELGFNVGASWLQSDVKMKKLGGAGGLTLGQMYGQNDRNALDWGWRFRYLSAMTYGQDTKKSTGIANNPILNGAYDTAYNYNSNGGFVYQNYRTNINELSLELVIGANQLRNKTKVYPYVFGGLGITKAVTKTNLLDDNSARYNYMSVDSNGTANGSQITSSLNNLYDGTYETAAEGSESPRWKFMPSLGVGLGYQFTPGFSMGLEHKMTWALHDGLDGQQWANDNTLSPTKDKYHYSSVWLKFTFGRVAHTSSTNTTTTNTTTNTNTYTTSVGDKPTIKVSNPSISPYTSASQSYTVRATIKGVSSKSDIGLVYNGVSNTNFTYDATSQQFAFPLMLLNGNNTFMITATNANGSTTDNATVLFESPIVIPPPSPSPVVTITSPVSNPHSTTMNNATVLATVLNVVSQSQITVSVNGTVTGSFLYNASSKVLNVNSNLNPGANTFVISATNASGSDSKSITVIYSLAVVTPPPVVTFINPAVNPFTSSVAILPINAIVQNVTSIGQVNVTINGAPFPTGMLSFNPSTGQLNFNSNLMAGANNVTISASNVAGADSKTITILYNQPVATNPAPVVTITAPTINPYTTINSVETVNAIVLNITAASQITASINGINSSAFSYNMASKQLTFPVNLIAGANIVSISANNGSGGDSKSTTIIYSQPAAVAGPIVTITSPTVNPFNTSSSTATIIATVLNITSSSQIAVTLNGVSTPAFTYNMGTKQLSFTTSLIAGANIVTVAATTSSGSDSKSVTIIYSQPTATPAPIVTITVPNTNPFNTTSNIVAIAATVLNVTSASQIAVSINGISTSAFTYNIATKQLGLSASLIAGANIVTIAATSPAGSDSKSVTIIYTAPVVAAPIVTITSPATSVFNTSVPTATVIATVLNVVTSSQITVKVNEAIVPFTYNAATKQVSLINTLIAGANPVTISATTPVGSDSKTITIMYNEPVVVTPAPIVTIIVPNTNPFNTTNNTAAITATVLNVTSVGQISATINGGPVASGMLSFNASTGQLNFNSNLTSGSNTVIVSATNLSGLDSKSTVIIYTAPVVSPAPVVTITSPSVNPFNTSAGSAAITATVLNVTSSSQIAVNINGATVPFTYNMATKQLSLTTTLIAGANIATISATTPSGSDSKSTTIIYTAPVALPNPIVTFVTPTSMGGGSTVAIYNVEATVLNVLAASGIVVKVNGTTLSAFTYNATTKQVKFNATLIVGVNAVTITATNTTGTDTKSVSIKYRPDTTIDPLNPDTLNTPADQGNPNIHNNTVIPRGGGGTTDATGAPSIIFGLGNPYTSTVAIVPITAVVSGVTMKSGIVVKVNGVDVPFTYMIKTKTVSFSANVNVGSNAITITATNTLGVKTETLTVTR